MMIYRLVTVLLMGLVLAAMPNRAAGQFGMTEDPDIPLSAGINFQTIQAGQQAVVAVAIDVPDGYHVYSHAPGHPSPIGFEFKLNDTPGVKAAGVQFAEHVDYVDPAFGDVKVYLGRFITYVPIEIAEDAALGDLTLTGQVIYQACDENHCLPPAQVLFSVKTTVVAAGQAIVPAESNLFDDYDPSTAISAPVAKAAAGIDVFGWSISGDNYAIIFLAGLLAGVLFNVMPCVLPIIPIKAIGFYEVAKHNTARSLLLGGVFSAGIIATFAVLALLVLVLQVLNWGELFARDWFNIPVILVLVALSFSMFGFFSVNLPQSVYMFTPRHDTYSGNFLFGILTAILSTPCTFGLFFALLAWAATQPAAMGVLLMMTTGLGMALPYMVLAGFPQLARKFPRTGPWSEVIKQLAGFLLIGTALFFARRYLPVTEAVYWWILFAVVASAALFLVVRTLQIAPRAVPIGVAAFIAALIVVPSAWAVHQKVEVLTRWKPYSAEALAEARQAGRPVMLTFTADWCGNCHALEARLFASSAVRDALQQQNVTLLKVDLSGSNEAGWNLLKQHTSVAAIPFTAVYPTGADAPIALSGIYSGDDLITAIGTNGQLAIAE